MVQLGSGNAGLLRGPFFFQRATYPLTASRYRQGRSGGSLLPGFAPFCSTKAHLGGNISTVDVAMYVLTHVRMLNRPHAFENVRFPASLYSRVRINYHGPAYPKLPIRINGQKHGCRQQQLYDYRLR